MVTAKNKPDQYLTEITGSTASILSDVPPSLGGKGEHLGPFRLLESSLAACMNMTVRKAMEARGVAFDDISVTVSLDESVEGTTTFRYSVDVSGDMDDEAKKKIVKLARGCPVHKLLTKELLFADDSPLSQEK